MARRHAFLIAVIALVLMAAVPMIVSAQFTPEIFAVDQDVVDGTVNITRATVNGDGWVAVHADADGAPGDVIGYAPVMDGVNANVKVEVDPDAVTDSLYAALYMDEGAAGEFEAPDPDVPVLVGDEAVITSFQVTGIAETIIGTAREAGGFSTLLAAVDAAGLTKTLQGAGPFTVFAPSDDAFAALPEGTVDGLLEDLDTLTQVLNFHVLPERLAAADIADGAEATTAQGENVTFGVGDGVTVAGAPISATDIETSNGIIHVIDSVILPPAIAEALGLGAEEATVEEEEEEPEVPASISNGGQVSDGTTMIVDAVEAAVDGWVAIRADDGFQPGEVLGYAAVPAGVSEGVEVTLDTPLTEGQLLYASLHVDDGEIGVFEYPDADPVAMFQQSPVSVPFNALMGQVEAAATEEEEEEPEVPASIEAGFQETDGATVIVGAVEAAADGWVAIRADDAFQPGEVLGFVAVPAGISEDVEVALDTPLGEGQLIHASLHVDDGEIGVFEYPDADPVAMFQQSPVSKPFNIALAVAVEEAEAEMTPEPTEEATEEAEAEMTPEPTEEATEEAEAEMTPEEAEAEMTPEPTEEATEEAEAEMTPEPTEEATEEAAGRRSRPRKPRKRPKPR